MPEHLMWGFSFSFFFGAFYGETMHRTVNVSEEVNRKLRARNTMVHRPWTPQYTALQNTDGCRRHDDGIIFMDANILRFLCCLLVQLLPVTKNKKYNLWTKTCIH